MENVAHQHAFSSAIRVCSSGRCPAKRNATSFAPCRQPVKKAQNIHFRELFLIVCHSIKMLLLKDLDVFSSISEEKKKQPL